jgi:membrane protease YdiL (CAAX protease family)
LAIVPATGESAVQSFVRFPSGLLSFAALAVVAPLAEEIFFRGFVYGVLEQKSRVLAFLGAWLLFVVAHAPQTWGQWGALVAIAITSLVLTSLRAASRSTLVPALAHLAYNGLLALSTLVPAFNRWFFEAMVGILRFFEAMLGILGLT